MKKLGVINDIEHLTKLKNTGGMNKFGLIIKLVRNLMSLQKRHWY